MTTPDWIIILCITAILFTAIGILIGIFIMIKPVIRCDEHIDYDGADKLGGTDNEDDVETVYKTVYKMSDYGCEEIKDKEQENI